MANWDTFLDQDKQPVYCPECHIQLVLNFEEFLGESEAYIDFYFEEAK